MDQARNEFKFAIAMSPLAPNCQQQGIGSASAPWSQGLGESIADRMPTPGGVSHVSIDQISE